jgi:hypothetical protein
MFFNRMGSHEEMGEHASAASFTAAPDMRSSAKALTAAAAVGAARVAHTAAHSMLPPAVLLWLCCRCVATRCQQRLQHTRQAAHSSSCCHAGHADLQASLAMHNALLSSVQAAGFSLKLHMVCTPQLMLL